MDRVQKALENHKKGMNCCQAVACAFADALGAYEDLVFAMGEGFGATYQLSKAVVKEFREKNGSVICKELKGVGTGKILRSCDGCIEDAARLAQQILEL